MKALILTITTLCLLARSGQAMPKDSLVINFANRTKLVVYAPSKKGIQALSGYDLNKIVREMGMKLDSVPNGQTYIRIDEQTGQRYRKDTVLVVTQKGSNLNVSLNASQDFRNDTTENTERGVYQRFRNRRKNSDLKLKTDFLIGLNNWISQRSSPLYSRDDWKLRPIGSRFFAVNLYLNPTLARSKTVKLSLRYGLELAWNNYMFDKDIRLEKATSQVVLTPASEPLKKSKSTVTSILLPVMPQLSFYNNEGRKTFHIGLGGFIGYRLDSYTKVKYQNNDKDRIHSNYYLNDLQYGLAANIGLLKADLFVRYNLNNIFQTDRGPDLRTLSFGISI